MKNKQLNVCHSCRRRKLGCDGKRESCTQCTQRGLKCGGYEYDALFLKPITAAAYNGSSKSRNGTLTCKTRGKGSKANTHLSISSRPSYPTYKTLPWSLDDALSLIIHSFVPSPTSPSPSRSNRVCGTWIEVISQLSTAGPSAAALSSCTRALAIAILCKDGAKASMVDALTAYGNAFRSVNVALAHVNAYEGPSELSIAIQCLLLSEILLPLSNSATTHAIGLARLIHSRGPEFYVSEVPHKVLAGTRPAMILFSIVARRSTFIGSEVWCAIPFQHIPATPVQRVMTIGSSIASALEQLDRLDGSSTCDDMHRNIQLLQDILNNLNKWHSWFLSLARTSLFATKVSSGGAASLHFIDTASANGLNYYWAFSLICLKYCNELSSLCPSAHTSPRSENMASPVELATWIFQSVKYLTRDDQKLFGAMSLVFPLRIAYGFLESHGDAQALKVPQEALRRLASKGYVYLIAAVSQTNGVLRPLTALRDHRCDNSPSQ